MNHLCVSKWVETKALFYNRKHYWNLFGNDNWHYWRTMKAIESRIHSEAPEFSLRDSRSFKQDSQSNSARIIADDVIVKVEICLQNIYLRYVRQSSQSTFSPSFSMNLLSNFDHALDRMLPLYVMNAKLVRNGQGYKAHPIRSSGIMDFQGFQKIPFVSTTKYFNFWFGSGLISGLSIAFKVFFTTRFGALVSFRSSSRKHCSLSVRARSNEHEHNHLRPYS